MAPPRPTVECEMHHTILAVADLGAALDFYTEKLGFLLAFTWGDPPDMAGVNLGRVQIFLERGEPSPSAAYFVVGDADALHAYQQEMGVEVLDPLADRPWGLREYTVRDLDGHRLTFGHRLCPPD